MTPDQRVHRAAILATIIVLVVVGGPTMIFGQMWLLYCMIALGAVTSVCIIYVMFMMIFLQGEE